MEFRQKSLAEYREKFAHLALGQRPDTLFITCSDSRVVPNVFVSTDPGDLFVVRNVGNLIPPYHSFECHQVEQSETAAIDFAVMTLGIRDIIVCGHSECGAMHAILSEQSNPSSNVRQWLCNGEEALSHLKQYPDFAKELSEVNRVSQLNVLLQLAHLKSYPIVQEALQENRLRLHGWWFELKNADVYAYDEKENKFLVIDEERSEHIIQKLNKKSPG